MGQFETALVALLMACNTTVVVVWRSNGTGSPSAITLRSNALSFHVFGTQSLVATLTTACGSPSITSITCAGPTEEDEHHSGDDRR